MSAAFVSTWNAAAPVSPRRADAMLARIAQLRALEQRAAGLSRAKPCLKSVVNCCRVSLVALLLDPGAPYLPLMSLAGYLRDKKDAALSGARWRDDRGHKALLRACMVVVQRLGHRRGAIPGRRAGEDFACAGIALENRLPFVHLVESAGANLMNYHVEGFVHGGSAFRNLARLSAAGLPVITVQHGSGTAGGAHAGLSMVIMVRGRSRAFWPGPPLLKAATGEVATEEEVGRRAHAQHRLWLG